MAITNGKLEREIKVPTANWTFRVSNSSASPAVATITLTAANTYYWSTAGNDSVDLAARLTALMSAGPVNYTVTIPATTSAEGLITIASADSSPFTMDLFTEGGSASDNLPRLLGFSNTAALAVSANSFTGDQQVQGLWLPDAPFFWVRGNTDFGRYQTDLIHTESAAGHTKVVYSQKKRILSLTWNGLNAAKAYLAGEDNANESFQSFWVHNILGEKSYCAQPGGPIRWHPDASVDATTAVGTYFIPIAEDLGDLMREDWIQLVNLTIERMVEVPGGGGTSPTVSL